MPQPPISYLYGLEVFVHHADGGGPFADGGCHTLARSMARVAGREHAGHAGLEQEGIAVRRPRLRPLRVDEQIAPGQDEPLRVTLDEPRDDLRHRHRSDEDEQRVRWHVACLAGADVGQRDALEPSVAMYGRDDGVAEHID